MLSRVAVSAGEPSGDEHAAALVSELRKLLPAVEVRGMGGKSLRNAGLDAVVDAEKAGSVMGFGPVLGAFSQIFSALSSMKTLLREWRPDALVLVDYPDFNLRLARYAKSLGIKVFYFIPPKMWAWRSGRIEQFHRFVDAVGLIFPFEKEFFLSRGYDRAAFLGHPYVDTLRARQWDEREKAKFRGLHGLDDNRPILAVLPGSRWFEIERHLGAVIEVLQRLQEKHPEVQSAIAVAPAIDAQKLQALIPAGLDVRIIKGEALSLMRVATAGLLKSGTSNLQATFLDLPSLMFYTAPALTKLIVDNFVRIKEYSLPNIIRPGTIKEVTGSTLDTQAITAELDALLFEPEHRAAIRAGYDEIISTLGNHDPLPAFTGAAGAYARAARLLMSL